MQLPSSYRFTGRVQVYERRLRDELESRIDRQTRRESEKERERGRERYREREREIHMGGRVRYG